MTEIDLLVLFGLMVMALGSYLAVGLMIAIVYWENNGQKEDTVFYLIVLFWWAFLLKWGVSAISSVVAKGHNMIIRPDADTGGVELEDHLIEK